MSVRVLPPDEWNRLSEIGPFATAQVLPDPVFATVIVEEDDQSGEIVGCWMVTSIMLLEGLWRREDRRKSPTGARRLLFGMIDYLRNRRVKTAITAIQDAEVESLALKAGFHPVPGGGRLYTVQISASEEDR